MYKPLTYAEAQKIVAHHERVLAEAGLRPGGDEASKKGRTASVVALATGSKDRATDDRTPMKKTKICNLCTVFGEGPCSPKCLEAAEDKAGRAIHAEHNRHEGLTTPWACLHKFQRMKYRAKGYAVLVALGAPKKKATSRRSNHRQSDTAAKNQPTLTMPTPTIENNNATDIRTDKAVVCDALVSRFRALSENAYLEYIGCCRKDECLGWEAKVEHGRFGVDELEAHKRAAEWLGKHRAYARAAEELTSAKPKLSQMHKISDVKTLTRGSCASWLWRLVRRLGCVLGLCGGVCRDGAWRCTRCGKTLNYHDN